MITLEISYLYNSRSSEWQPMITSALVLDILAFLLFTSLLQEDSRTAAKAGNTTVALMAIVGVASFASSFLTILYTRGYEQYYNRRHGLKPLDPMHGTNDPFPHQDVEAAFTAPDSSSLNEEQQDEASPE